MWNFQGIDPSVYSRSSHKLQHFIEEHVNNSEPVFISGCETWLKPHITNAQVNIPGYQIVRQDRVDRHRGGVILYIKDSLPVCNTESFDDGTCAAVICLVKSINTIIASIYRPPPSHSNSSFDSVSFKNLLSFLQVNIDKNSNGHSDIILTGDFNFPNIQWDPTINSSVSPKPTEVEEFFLSFIEDNLLCQYITQPTRESNILDLFLTNNSNLVLHSSSTTSPLSDHDLVSVKTTYNLTSPQQYKKPQIPEDSFRSLNLYKADFDQINAHLESIAWDDLKAMCTPEEFPELLRLTVLQVCILYSPTKSKHSHYKNFFVRERDILRRRKRKVKPQIKSLSAKNPKSRKLQKLRSELYDLDNKIKESTRRSR